MLRILANLTPTAIVINVSQYFFFSKSSGAAALIDVLSLTERSWADVKDFMTQQKSFIFFLNQSSVKPVNSLMSSKKKNWRTFSHSHEEDLNQNANDGGDKLCSRFRTSRSDKPTRACEVKVAVLRIYQPAFNNYTTSKLIKEPVYLSVDAKGASKSSPKIHTVPHLWMFLKTALCSHLWSAPYFVFSLYLGLICMQPAFCSL